MSSHNIRLDTPALGLVDVVIGYDATLNEAFLSLDGVDQDVQFLSPAHLSVNGIQPLAIEKLGCELPAAMIEAVHQDLVDLRITGDARACMRTMRSYEPHTTPA